MANTYTFTIEDILKSAEKQSEGGTSSKSEQTAASSNAAADESKRQLLDSLAAIDEKYGYNGVDYPETLGLEKMEYNAPSDEEIKEQADSLLAYQKVAGENAINADAQRQKEDLEQSKIKAEQSTENLVAALENDYAERKSAAEKEALKRGLARSSIIMNKIEEFDKGKIEGEAQLRQDLYQSLDKIDFNISSLETAREKALADFDIEFASEISKKINELKKERESKNQEVLKYNNTVEEKEVKHQVDKSAAEQKALENYIKNQEEYQKLAMDEKLKTVKNYYDAMPPSEALKDFLKDSSMQRTLKEYYDYMLLYLKVRASS